MYPTSLVALERFQVVQYDIYKPAKKRLFVVMGDAVVFTNNLLFICSCRKEEAFFWNFCIKTGDCSKHNGCYLNFAISSGKMNLKTTNF